MEDHRVDFDSSENNRYGSGGSDKMASGSGQGIPYYMDDSINVEKHRFPHCIVWTPIPLLTYVRLDIEWLIPRPRCCQTLTWSDGGLMSLYHFSNRTLWLVASDICLSLCKLVLIIMALFWEGGHNSLTDSDKWYRQSWHSVCIIYTWTPAQCQCVTHWVKVAHLPWGPLVVYTTASTTTRQVSMYWKHSTY